VRLSCARVNGDGIGFARSGSKVDPVHGREFQLCIRDYVLEFGCRDERNRARSAPELEIKRIAG
jgi:hypothetical protein